MVGHTIFIASSHFHDDSGSVILAQLHINICLPIDDERIILTYGSIEMGITPLSQMGQQESSKYGPRVSSIKLAPLKPG